MERKIEFDGYMPAKRQVTVTQHQLYSLFEAMKQQFKTHVEFTTLRENDYLFPEDKIFCDICKSHGVNFRIKREREAFLNALLNSMENPYK